MVETRVWTTRSAPNGVAVLMNMPLRCRYCGMISTPHLYCDIDCHYAAHPDEYMDCLDSCVDDGWLDDRTKLRW